MRVMTLTLRFQVRRFLLNPVLTLVLFLLTGAYAVAQTNKDNWISPGTDPASEDWFNFDNWSLKRPPQSLVDPAFVNNGGIARISGPPPVEVAPASAVSLKIRGGSKVVDGSQSALSIDGQILAQNGEFNVSRGGAVSLGSLTIGAGGLVSIGTGGAGETLNLTNPASAIRILAGGNLEFNLTDTTILNGNNTGAGTIEDSRNS